MIIMNLMYVLFTVGILLMVLSYFVPDPLNLVTVGFASISLSASTSSILSEKYFNDKNRDNRSW